MTAEQEERIAAVRRDLEAWYTGIGSEEVEVLLAVIEELRGDAARLDFLEAKTVEFRAPNLRTWGDEISVAFYCDPVTRDGKGRNLREAIDAARTAHPAEAPLGNSHDSIPLSSTARKEDAANA